MDLRAISRQMRVSLVHSVLRDSMGRCEGRKSNGATPEELAVIERMFAWRKERKSFAEIAATLNAENVPTRTPGRKWHTTQVQRIMGRAGRGGQKRGS